MTIHCSMSVHWMFVLYRISYEELDTEIRHWREEITKCKDELEAAEDTPQDLADQVNVFIPVNRHRNKYHVTQHTVCTRSVHFLFFTEC